MTDNDIVRRGYLNVVRNPQGGVIGRVKSVTSRRQWVVLRRESGGRPSRIEVYRSEDQSVEPNRVISLGGNSLRNIETLERKKAFVLILRDSESCMFQCSSRADMEDWYRDIHHHNSGRTGSMSSSHGMNTGEIYEVIPDDETFRVRLRKAKTLPFHGPCLLEILRDFERNLFHIAMFTEEELPRLIVKWQIDHIRQYGSNNMAFKFESGSKSSTGVDWFVLDTEPGCAVRIHKAVDYWAKHIVEQVKNTSGAASSPIDTGVVEVERLIEAVRGLPCLWQVSCTSNKNQQARDKAWAQVAKQIKWQDTIDNLHKKWKTLRDKFVRELKKVRSSEICEDGYSSQWPYYDSLLFLQSSVRHRRSKPAVVSGNRPDTAEGSDLGDFSMAEGPSSPCHSTSSTASSPLSLPVLKKRKLEGVEVELGDIGGALGCVDDREVVDEVEQLPSQLSSLPLLSQVSQHSPVYAAKTVEDKKALVGRRLEEDAEDLFGRQIAANLRRLTNRQKADAKARIQQVMLEVEFPDDAAGPQRHNSIPSPPITPDNTRPSKNSLPRGGSHGPDNTNTYMAINQDSRAPNSVYASPDQSKPQKNSGRSKPPAAPPGGTASTNNSTYMSLNPNSMNAPQQTYEGISPRGRNGPAVNGDKPDSSLYMGIDPRTRDSTEKAQYMGLKDARSAYEQ